VTLKDTSFLLAYTRIGYNSFRHFLGFNLQESEHELSVITTNYDINVECAINRAGRRANPTFQFRRGDDKKHSATGNLYDPRGIPLYKLHGSVNWYEDVDNSGITLVEDRTVTVVGSDLDHVSLPLICVSNYECEDQPIIVPPSYLKPEFKNPLLDTWRGAARALQDAHIVAFVGYSFPPTDIEMRYFLARSLVNNVPLKEIAIFDTRADEIVGRLKADHNGFGSHFKDFLKPVNGNWTNQSLSKATQLSSK